MTMIHQQRVMKNQQLHQKQQQRCSRCREEINVESQERLIENETIVEHLREFFSRHANRKFFRLITPMIPLKR